MLRKKSVRLRILKNTKKKCKFVSTDHIGTGKVWYCKKQIFWYHRGGSEDFQETKKAVTEEHSLWMTQAGSCQESPVINSTCMLLHRQSQTKISFLKSQHLWYIFWTCSQSKAFSCFIILSLYISCVYLWMIHVDVWQKPTKFCKAIILPLKNKLIKKIISYSILIHHPFW